MLFLDLAIVPAHCIPICDAKGAGVSSMQEMAAPKLTRKELTELLRDGFPEISNAMGNYEIDELWYGGCRLRHPFSENSLRPGGTLSGTTMMSLADFAMYIAVLSAIGWVPLAVTTSLTINFLKKPAARDLVAEARLIKLGRRLAVGEIGIRSAGEEALVAHATSTYSIPARGV
jgi:uncharacterized protein (TIGR00369 family)